MLELITVHDAVPRLTWNSRRKQLILVGDRVLITPRKATTARASGCTCRPPRSIRQQVQGGLIVATGPGDAVADIVAPDDEPWKTRSERRKSTMQARVGDHAIFFRKAAVEITFEERKYLVVPQAALLVIVREDLPI